MKKNQITIIGCGVSGLTTAIVMLETGYQVQIVTDKLPNKTTSIKAVQSGFRMR